jgi:alkylation response protein AidB-like acyl-CoA dehydrogenase
VSDGLDLDFDDVQRAIGDAVGQLCRDQVSAERVKALAGEFPHELWRQLAELGVLGLATPGGEGGPLELIAALEPLGRAVFPGPLAATVLAAQLLDGEARAALVAGESIAAVGTPPLLPWAPVADLFIEIDGARAWRARPVGAVEPLQTLGGEPWGRVALERGKELGEAGRALALHDAALAAYLAAAGLRLVDDAAEHARTRVQFGRPIGEFQGVALPLADCRVRLDAAALLARAAACKIEAGAADARLVAGAARLSARAAALLAAHVGHQVFGAIGITLEGPVFHISRRIRQLASQPPDPAPAREALLAGLAL